MATTSPGSTPWWTDQEAQNPNVGGAGADYTQVQNPSTSTLGISPQYLQALQAMGYRGGMPNTPQGYQALQQFIQQRGLTSKTSFLDQQGTGDQISALFDANGNQAPGTQRQYASDVNSDAFLGAILGAGAFGGAAAAGVGAGAGGGVASTGGGGLAGTGLPEYSAYGGVGSGASAPLAGDATGTGIFGSGAAGAGLSSADTAAMYGAGGYGAAATPAEIAAGGAGTGGLLGSGSGILGSSVTGGDVMGGLGSAAKFASSPGGGALIGAGLGLLGNKGGLNSATSTQTKAIDPRLVPYVYGSNGTGGILGDATNLYKQQMATGGLNANQTAGLNSQLSVLNNPNYSTGFNQERALGSSLLNQGVAGNPFTGSGTAYAGTPQFSAQQPSAPMPGQPPSLLQKPYGPMSGVPNRVAPGGLLGA